MSDLELVLGWRVSREMLGAGLYFENLISNTEESFNDYVVEYGDYINYTLQEYKMPFEADYLFIGPQVSICLTSKGIECGQDSYNEHMEKLLIQWNRFTENEKDFVNFCSKYFGEPKAYMVEL